MYHVTSDKYTCVVVVISADAHGDDLLFYSNAHWKSVPLQKILFVPQPQPTEISTTVKPCTSGRTSEKTCLSPSRPAPYSEKTLFGCLSLDTEEILYYIVKFDWSQFSILIRKDL